MPGALTFSARKFSSQMNFSVRYLFSFFSGALKKYRFWGAKGRYNKENQPFAWHPNVPAAGVIP